MTLSDHLRGLQMRESLTSWWDRMSQALCDAEGYGIALYNVVTRLCEPVLP